MKNTITKNWIDEQGEGHWELSYGGMTVSCDDSELTETINDLLAA